MNLCLKSCVEFWPPRMRNHISETSKVESEEALRNVTRIIRVYQKYVMASENKYFTIHLLILFFGTST